MWGIWNTRPKVSCRLMLVSCMSFCDSGCCGGCCTISSTDTNHWLAVQQSESVHERYSGRRKHPEPVAVVSVISTFQVWVVLFSQLQLFTCHFNFLWDLLSITHCCVSSICLNIQSVLYWLVLAVCSSEAMQQSAYAGANSKNVR